jgi:hypothetical protein
MTVHGNPQETTNPLEIGRFDRGVPGRTNPRAPLFTYPIRTPLGHDGPYSRADYGNHAGSSGQPWRRSPPRACTGACKEWLMR